MKPTLTPLPEINRRISAIQKQIQASKMDALFIVQRMDLFYFSGTAQNGYLFIPAAGKPLLMIRKYLPRAKKETSLDQIIGIDSVKEVPKRILDFYGQLPDVIGFEFDVMPVREFHFFQKIFNVREYHDGSALIHTVRMIKSDWEIEQLQNTAELSSKTFKFIEEELKPGFSEIEFSGMYEVFARKLGHQAKIRVRDYLAEGFSWHVLSGKSGGMVGMLDSPASGEGSSPSFPCGAGRKKIKKNEPIMIDIALALNGYHFDETRMFAIGSMPDKALKACQTAIDIHDAVIEKAAPGVLIRDLFQYSIDRAESLGYEMSFLGPPGHKVHFIGHGIGLELVEPPILARKAENCLMPGMVLALEPKLVFKNEFSAGIESVILITDKGNKMLSKAPAKVFIKQ